MLGSVHDHALPPSPRFLRPRPGAAPPAPPGRRPPPPPHLPPPPPSPSPPPPAPRRCRRRPAWAGPPPPSRRHSHGRGARGAEEGGETPAPAAQDPGAPLGHARHRRRGGGRPRRARAVLRGRAV